MLTVIQTNNESRSLVHFGKIKSGLEYAVKLGRGSNIQLSYNGASPLPIKVKQYYQFSHFRLMVTCGVKRRK